LKRDAQLVNSSNQTINPKCYNNNSKDNNLISNNFNKSTTSITNNNNQQQSSNTCISLTDNLVISNNTSQTNIEGLKTNLSNFNINSSEDQTNKNISAVSTAHSHNGWSHGENLHKFSEDIDIMKSIEDGIFFDSSNNSNEQNFIENSNTKSNRLNEEYNFQSKRASDNNNYLNHSPLSNSAKKVCGKPKLEFKFGGGNNYEENIASAEGGFLEPFENITISVNDNREEVDGVVCDLKNMFLNCVEDKKRKASGYSLYNNNTNNNLLPNNSNQN